MSCPEGLLPEPHYLYNKIDVITYIKEAHPDAVHLLVMDLKKCAGIADAANSLKNLGYRQTGI